MSEIIKFDDISFVSDEELYNSEEYKEMLKDLKEELEGKKIKEIVEKQVEKLYIEDTTINKVKNITEFLALQRYFLDYGMRFQDDWVADFSYGRIILIDNSVDNFIHVYFGEDVEVFKGDVEKLLNFI